MKKGKIIIIIIGSILIFLQLLGVIGNAKAGINIKLSFDNFSVFLYDLIFLLSYFLIGIIGIILLISGLYPYNKKPKSTIQKENIPIANKKGGRLPLYHIISVVLSAASILSIIIAMNVQDADRNIYEPLNPTVLYFVLIGVNIVYSVVLLFLKEHSILKGFMAFVPALFSIIARFEGSLFSSSYSYVGHSYVGYMNSETVYILNVVWVSLSFVILLVNLIPLRLPLLSKWHHSIRYREKCYKRVAKMKEYLNNGIISQEEFEKNKEEILRNIKM